MNLIKRRTICFVLELVMVFSSVDIFSFAAADEQNDIVDDVFASEEETNMIEAEGPEEARLESEENYNEECIEIEEESEDPNEADLDESISMNYDAVDEEETAEIEDYDEENTISENDSLIDEIEETSAIDSSLNDRHAEDEELPVIDRGEGDIVDSGKIPLCYVGDKLFWELTDRGNNTYALRIYGNGSIKNYDLNLKYEAVSSDRDSFQNIPWFKYKDDIETVTIEEGTKMIGESAFYSYASLREVDLPDGLTSIGVSAFENCKSLERIVFPDGLTYIGIYAFENCISLESVVFPDGLSFIDRHAFENCKSLESIVIPDGIQEISAGVFQGCEKLRTVTLPSSLIYIRYLAFAYCPNLERIIYYGSDLKDIAEGAFVISYDDTKRDLKKTGLSTDNEKLILYDWENDNRTLKNAPHNNIHIKTYDGNWTNARSITYSLSESKDFSGKYDLVVSGNGFVAFYYCVLWNLFRDDIVRISFEGDMKEIVQKAFYGCDGLEYIVIPNNIRIINDEAFAKCSKLKKIVFEPPTTTVSDPAITMHDRGTTTYFYLDIHDRAFAECPNLTYIEAVEVKYISGMNVFYVSPESVDTPLRTVFKGELKYDYFWRADNRTIVWADVSSVSLNKTEATMRLGDELLLTATIFPESVVNNSIIWQSSDPKVVSVTDGRVKALSQGTAKIIVKTENGGKTAECEVTVTDYEIGDVISYGKCGKSLYYNLTLISKNPAKYSLNINGKGSISDNMIANSPLFDTLSQNNVDDISLCISEGVTEIGLSAFENCGITSVELPDSLTRIKSNAFSGCKKLESIVIPDGIFIEYNAFSECSSLANVKLPQDLNILNSGVFSKCRMLDDLVLPNKLLSIQEGAFQDCESLTSLVLPKEIRSISDNAFAGCNNLKYIEYHGFSLEEIGTGVFKISGSNPLETSVQSGCKFFIDYDWENDGRNIIIEVWKSALDPLPLILDDTSTITLVKGQKFILTDGEWESSDKSALSVSKKGAVSAKKAVSGVVFSRKENGKVVRSINVTIIDPAIDKKLTLITGAEKRISLIGYRGLNVSWFSSAPDVATVADDGTVRAICKGSSVITAYVNGVAFNCKVTVKDVDTGKRNFRQKDPIVLTPMQSVSVKADGFKASNALWSSNLEAVPNAKLGKGIAYENHVVRITDSGMITAIGAGTTTLIAKGQGGTLTFTVEVPEPVTQTVHLNVSGHKTIKLYGTKGTLQWSASDTSIVEIEKNKITGLKAGTTILTTKYENLEYKVIVYVEDPAITTKGITGSFPNYTLDLKAGQTVILTEKQTYQNVLYKSNKNNIAFVDEAGILTARSTGKAVITAKVNGKKIKITVNVK